jgi:hypothetical protein
MLEPRIVKTLFGLRTGPGDATATAIDICAIRHSQENQISRQTVTKVTEYLLRMVRDAIFALK